MKIGETKQLDVSFYPENANKHPELVWESDDDKVATVSQEGLVSAMGSGKTVVTARTSDGSLWGTCKVRVITKVTALALYYPDNCIWGGADYDNIIKFTSTPSTAVAADFIWESTTCAEKMIADWGTEQQVNIVELTGTPGSTCAIERQKGFMDAIAAHSNYKVIASQVGDFSRTTSQTAMENIIQAYGDQINVVYAHNDDNAIGALQAIKAAGLTPGVDIKIYSIDGQKDAAEAIANGEMACTVVCSPFFGETVLSVINTLENGGTVEAYIQNPGKLIDAANIQEYLPEAY